MPNDAYITCLRPGGYPIPDLKLRLRRGESVWVSAGRASTSTDLTTAIKTGAVSCSWVDPNSPTKNAPLIPEPVPCADPTPLKQEPPVVVSEPQPQPPVELPVQESVTPPTDTPRATKPRSRKNTTQE